MDNESLESGSEKGDVCQRLLDAAERLFCENGYDRTSVRDITAAAGCNIAAVNYHFGGKDKLYLEMFRRRMRQMIKRHLETIERIGGDPEATLEDLVFGLIDPKLNHLGGEDRQDLTLDHLMIQEVVSQRLETHEVVGDIKAELFTPLAEAIRRFYPKLTLREAKLAVISIDSLIVHPLLFKEYYRFLIPELTAKDVVEQIVKFGAAGIRGCVKGLSSDE